MMVGWFFFLFNGISTFVGYLIPKASFEKNSSKKQMRLNNSQELLFHEIITKYIFQEKSYFNHIMFK